MAVAFESYTHDFVTDTSDLGLAPAKPTGLTAGDLLVALCGCVTSRTVSAPNGTWTTLANHADAVRRVQVHYKVADSGDAAAASFAFTVSGSFSQAGVVLLRFSGADTAGILAQFTDAANSNSAACPDITPPAANSLVIWGLYQNGNTSPMSSTRGTERADVGSSVASCEQAFGVYTEEPLAATSQTGPTITKSGFGASITFAVAIAPSGGGGGSVGAVAAGPLRQQRNKSLLRR